MGRELVKVRPDLVREVLDPTQNGDAHQVLVVRSRLREILAEDGWKPYRWARSVGIDHDTLRRLLTMRQRSGKPYVPNLATAYQVALELGRTVEEVFPASLESVPPLKRPRS